MLPVSPLPLCFFFNAPPTTEIYTLSLHDALPISAWPTACENQPDGTITTAAWVYSTRRRFYGARCLRPTSRRSEEHTSELQSRPHLVCRLLLEKKKKRRDRNRDW